jgi:hypothetical protein
MRASGSKRSGLSETETMREKSMKIEKMELKTPIRYKDEKWKRQNNTHDEQ